jgi:hypothetical protein
VAASLPELALPAIGHRPGGDLQRGDPRRLGTAAGDPRRLGPAAGDPRRLDPAAGDPRRLDPAHLAGRQLDEAAVRRRGSRRVTGRHRVAKLAGLAQTAYG